MFVVVTIAGVQVLLVDNVNCGVIGDSTQIVFTIVSIPHLFPDFKVIVYVPGNEKIGHITLDPDNHKLGSESPK